MAPLHRLAGHSAGIGHLRNAHPLRGAQVEVVLQEQPEQLEASVRM